MTGACAGKSKVRRTLFNRENLWALLFALILIALLILTSGSEPLWIYTGF